MDKYIAKLLRESLLDEDYPDSFNMGEFKTLTSYKKRIAYCKEHLKRLGAGSSRIVFLIDDDKVLKLAKNRKGLAQNMNEASISNSEWHEEYVAKVLDYHQEDLWIEMELAKKLRKGDFERITSWRIEDVNSFLMNHFYLKNGKKAIYHMDQALVDEMVEDEFIQGLQSIIDNWEAHPGDMGRESSYGKVKRNGKEIIVLVDYGITAETVDTYYSIN